MKIYFYLDYFLLQEKKNYHDENQYDYYYNNDNLQLL